MKNQTSANAILKIFVFNTFINVDIDDIVLIYRGSEFHKLGAFTENALSP